MSDTVLIGASQQQFLAMLSPEERMIAESLLQAAPNYRYQLRGVPPPTCSFHMPLMAGQ